MSEGGEATPKQHGVRKSNAPWLPGQSGNPKGRPKGARNRLAEDFVADALAAWRQHGPASLQTMATDDPSKFCQMIASLLPRELSVKTSPVEELSEDELAGLVSSIQQLVAAANAQNFAAGADTSVIN